MPAIGFDLIILAVLALSVWRGAKKGLIFTLFGLLALLVALVGSNLAANALAPKAAEAVAPKLSQAIETELGEGLAQAIPKPETILSEDNALPGIFGVIQETDLYADIVTSIVESVQDGIEQAATTLSGVIARAIAQSVAHGIIYLLSFVIILVIWFASAHILDFVCGLPILHGLNAAGGMLLGLIRGGLILLAAAWLLCTFLGLVPEETVEQSFLLKHFVEPKALGTLFGV